MNELYTDGGCIDRNPSPFGLTYAFRIVADDAVIGEDAHALPPSAFGVATLTNNNAELYALCMGLFSLPSGWTGRVNSDSQLALGWIFFDYKTDTIPASLLGCLRDARHIVRRSPGQFTWRLLQGHPTRADLARGIGAKRGFPVSIHNVACDRACRRAGQTFMALRSPAESPVERTAA